MVRTAKHKTTAARTTTNPTWRIIMDILTLPDTRRSATPPAARPVTITRGAKLALHRPDGSVGDDVYWKSERLKRAEE